MCIVGLPRSCLEHREKVILSMGGYRIGHVVKVVKLRGVSVCLDEMKLINIMSF